MCRIERGNSHENQRTEMIANPFNFGVRITHLGIAVLLFNSCTDTFSVDNLVAWQYADGHSALILGS